MGKRFEKQNPDRAIQSRKAAAEFRKGRGGLLVCGTCNNFYYKKSWHHEADKFVAEREDKDLVISSGLCPACKMIKNHQYEGKITILNAPEKIKDELLHLIKNLGEKFYSLDPMDRIISIEDGGKGEITITTTENQMANKIAKHIKDVFHKVKTKTVFAKDPSDVVLITAEFL